VFILGISPGGGNSPEMLNSPWAKRKRKGRGREEKPKDPWNSLFPRVQGVYNMHWLDDVFINLQC